MESKAPGRPASGNAKRSKSYKGRKKTSVYLKADLIESFSRHTRSRGLYIYEVLEEIVEAKIRKWEAEDEKMLKEGRKAI